MSDVSVAVPAYNEEECVTDAIDALAELEEYTDERWLIDDGSEDGTADVAEAYIEEHDLAVDLYRNEENGGKVGAIQNAVEDVIDTEYLALMDADSWIENPEELEGAVEYMKEEDRDALGFQVVPEVQSDSLYQETLEEMQKRGYAFGRMLHRLTSWNFGREDGRLRHMAGAGYISETDTLNEALEHHSYEFDGEDMQTTAIMQLQLDETVEYYPDVTVKTEVPDSMRELFSQRKGWNHGALHTYAECGEEYLGQMKRYDEPLTHYTLYETIFLTGIAPVLAAGVAKETVEGNFEPAAAWYLTDTLVTTVGLEAGYQTDELEDRSYVKYLPLMAPYRAAAFFPGKIASYPEFLHKQGRDLAETLDDDLADWVSHQRERLGSAWDSLTGNSGK